MIDSDKILIMGHQREDYDALGGIIGVVAIARALGKERAHCTFKETSAIDKMVNVLRVRVLEREYYHCRILPRVW